MTRDDIVSFLLPVVERLNETGIPYVLVGGVAVPFYLSDDLANHVRPTKDIDVIVAAAKLAQFDRVEERLRKFGFVNHPEIRHRWLLGTTLIDVMPAESDIMVTINRWYRSTFETAEVIEIASGHGVRIASPACFLATKMEAFMNRGGGDFLASHDLEDFVSVIDGRHTIIKDLANNCPLEVREFLRTSVKHLLGNRVFLDALEGYLPPNFRTNERLVQLRARLAQFVE
jgi:predicted nucleotidyltransferase